jgi:hypothetical protein
MAHLAVIGNDRLGPVAEVSTRERCIALYPGSSPGRASSLRCSAASARQASQSRSLSPAIARRATAGLHCSAASARQASFPHPSQRGGRAPKPLKPSQSKQKRACRAVARRAKAGWAPFWGLRGCGIWSKDRPAREGNPRSWLRGRAARAPFFCAQNPVRET